MALIRLQGVYQIGNLEKSGYWANTCSMSANFPKNKENTAKIIILPKTELREAGNLGIGIAMFRFRGPGKGSGKPGSLDFVNLVA